MTVRLEVKHSLLAGLTAAIAALGSLGVSGCSSLDSITDLDPAGPPKIVQVFVLDSDAEDYVLAYGIHRDLNRCGFDKDQCSEGFTCDTSTGDPQKTNADHCVDSSGHQPGVEAATASGASIRIVSKELLNPETVEQFVCACGAGCPAGKDFSLKPDCGVCGDDPATMTFDETGKCVDLNDDGLPDLTTLLPGVASVTCGTLLTYATDIGDGYYYPSGFQLPTSQVGYAGLGPAIVLNLQVDLPTNADCTVAIDPKVHDKEGNSFAAPDRPVTFHTEALAVPAGTGFGSAPAKSAKNVAVDIKSVTIGFNSTLKGSTVTASSVKLTEKGGADVAAVGPPTVMAGTHIVLPLTAALKAATTYTVTVAATVTDSYGQALPAAVTYDFMTK